MALSRPAKSSRRRSRSHSQRHVQAAIESLESRLLLSTTELIRNGGFTGVISPADWSTTGDFQADSRFTNYHNGPGYAYLSDLNGNTANNISGALYQQLTIPTNPTSLTLTFWTKITTQETTTTAANDTMIATVYDSAGTNVLQSLATYSNLNASTSYIQRTFFLNRSLTGQTVRIFFSAATDAQLPTTFRIDDVSLNAVSLTTGLRSVGYFPDGRFGLRNQIDFTAVTHVNYADASLDASGNFVTSGWLTLSNLDTMVSMLHADGDTVSITVYSSTNFPTVSASPTARATFASQAVAFCLAHNLDGIDIDWEPPAKNNNADYAALIDALYSAGHSDHLLITAAVNPLETEIPVATVNAEMDWVNVMCYDFSSSDHSTYADATKYMAQWASDGTLKSKLLMGLPFYAREGASYHDAPNVYTNVVPGYFNLYGVDPPPNIDSYYDPAILNTWYFNGVNTIEKKCDYVRDSGFGGVMIWELGEDHWDANNKYDQYSLLPVIKTMMLPPAWLTPAAGSWSHLVNQQFFVDAGSVTVNSDVSLTNPNLTVTVASGASLTMSSPEHLAGLTTAGTVTVPAGRANTLVTASLSITGSGKLDLNDNALILPYSGTSPVSTIQSYLATGHGAGPGAAATWTGIGIDSTYAHTNGNGFNLAVGEADNAALAGVGAGSYTAFGGQPVTTSSILVQMTYGADANLDGKVDGQDVSILGTQFGKPGSGQWYLGDFDYSGMVDGSDVSVLGTTFGKTALVLGPAIFTPAPLAPALIAAATQSDPTPAIAEQQSSSTTQPSASPPSPTIATPTATPTPPASSPHPTVAAPPFSSVPISDAPADPSRHPKPRIRIAAEIFTAKN